MPIEEGGRGVVRSATYNEGYRAGINQAIIELEAEATQADHRQLYPYSVLLRAWADRLRTIRDRTP